MNPEAEVKRLVLALRDPEAIVKRRRPSYVVEVLTHTREHLTVSGYQRSTHARLLATWQRPEQGRIDVFRYVLDVGLDPCAEKLAEARRALARAVYEQEELNDRRPRRVR